MLTTIWLLPLLAIVGLLYYEFMIPAAPLAETNRAMRTRMCLEHVNLARNEPANHTAKTAVDECVVAGYITEADRTTTID